jgi:hypothetical protein
MASINGPDSRSRPHSDSERVLPVDFSRAREAYLLAIPRAEERHAEVGVLSPRGEITCARLGRDEPYGAHRVGSVTKTFTTFLALKLAHDGVLPRGLETRCVDVIPEEMLARVFEDVEAAKNMTLEQLLSHTSGLEFDDHCRPQREATPTLQARFLQESAAEKGRKYKHVCQPGDRIGHYSNCGLAVAAWMMEAAYNRHSRSMEGAEIPFTQIMKRELFEGVFGLSDSFIAPGPSGDIIQSGAGDMTSSVRDLMQVAARLQEGEASLEGHFGRDWQRSMLRPRDVFQHHGLGCTAGLSVIRHFGMNREMFRDTERDVTAVVEFPLSPENPGLVALCDSSALGPQPQEQAFIRALERSAGILGEEEARSPVYNLDFFCPRPAYLFHGSDYLATDVDPFTDEPPGRIICSRNGMRHNLTLDPSIEGRGYRDENGNPWIFILKEGGRKIIYSDLCLCTRTLDVEDLERQQPPVAAIRTLQGTYRNIEHSEEHPTYSFIERDGHLYMRTDNNPHMFPCLYVPDDSTGSWVVSDPNDRRIKIRFPANPDEDFLVITDVASDTRQPPYNSRRVH